MLNTDICRESSDTPILSFEYLNHLKYQPQTCICVMRPQKSSLKRGSVTADEKELCDSQLLQ